MNILILTSAIRGSASVQLNEILKSNIVHVKMVILNEGKESKSFKFYRRKFGKVLKIGVLGAINGARMRKWYSTDVEKYIDTPSIEKICAENNIPFKISPSINCPTTIALFKEANADLGLSLGNGYIGSKLYTIPKYGMINIHHEELPLYQNAQSVIWQVYNNSASTAYTIHNIDKNIDTGEIIYQESLPIAFRKTLADTVSYTYARLLKASAEGLIKTLENFHYYLEKRTAQTQGTSYTTPTLLEYLKIKKRYHSLKNKG